MPVSKLSYNLCVNAWKHLKTILQKGKKNKGQMQFLIVGFLREHPVSKWDTRMMRLFASHLRHLDPEKFSRKVEILTKSICAATVEDARVFVQKCREFELHAMNERRSNKEGSFVFGELEMVRILADEVEVATNLPTRFRHRK